MISWVKKIKSIKKCKMVEKKRYAGKLKVIFKKKKFVGKKIRFSLRNNSIILFLNFGKN